VSVGYEHLTRVAADQASRPGDGAMVFVFAKGEAVPTSHPAVLAFPHLFDFTRCAAGECDTERDE
jgi:hypothetical protein